VFFFLKLFVCSQSGDHPYDDVKKSGYFPKEDLAKSGYKPDVKYKF